MTAPAPNPRDWAVAAALAAESGLDWGLHALGIDERCSKPSCNAFKWVDGRCAWCGTKTTPVPVPWDADAYRADCARRGVEPGPLPSRSWTGDDGFGWRVCRTGVVFYAWADPIATWDPDDDVLAFVSAYPRELVARIVTLTTAAKRALQ